MFLADVALVRLLAMVTALLTVATGVPRIQCVCPDGRVKFNCPGPTSSRCCCDNSSAPGETGAAPSRCPTVGETHACCTRAKAKSASRSAGGGQAQASKPCGCQRTLVAYALVSTVEKAGDDDGEAGAPATWSGHVVVPKLTTRSGWAKRRFLLPPPDRVVLFCHFTC